ncbi:MAG: homocysteine S-methyltransferase family protein [Rhizobiales bacterium]|nr:homocysteine S-methyltransferase family protein [Hyphomicrobiales bacterium]
MTKYRSNLPQLGETVFLSDGGLETTMIFHEGIELPHFASFELLKNTRGRKALRVYFLRYVGIARKRKMGFILDTPTWRASADWGAKFNLTATELDRINRESVGFLVDFRAEMETSSSPMVINGVVGPRGDGYDPGLIMEREEAATYHRAQIASFAATEADMVSAITMTNVNEAIGIALAARAEGMPVAVSFTVETNGALPTGQTLRKAIEETDAATGGFPAYYMVNCAHPSHFSDKLAAGAAWMQRVRGIRANASRQSHAELNEAPELDPGNPTELGLEYGAIRTLHPHINVVGGCCGTDHRHIERISAAMKQVA